MRSNHKSRRPLTAEEMDLQNISKNDLGGRDLSEVVEKISLEEVSLEERRREAQKPLYLVRYE